ncbi:MAG: PAS domain-containing protein [Candidatus Competibacteraceae bacterium]|uniref:histidine kinase n=1 Tax=Candidatus Contendobacter odensis Run_B_J11 TaxID=1400861 RepID=A0A7U7GAL7_9GAMM|nr:ATP-binding protein [Candidatus Contendobacter odensis]MBK8537902.1 PAS domain-containing protein [Candidatus Competibacteraceae bacterium]CDH44646.1 putative Sensor protein pilS [Candidatus Contendobacter odensis Run_B_J11]
MIVSDPLAGLNKDRFPDRRHLWRVFRASHIYRLILAMLLLGAVGLNEQNRLFGKQAPALFLGAALIYLVLILLAIAGTYWRRPRLPVQAHLQMLVDLLALIIMIHASGGLNSSLNSLLITAVAASGILLPLSSALLAAALGFFLLTLSWLVSQWYAAQALTQVARVPDPWTAFMGQLRNATDDLVRLGVLGAVLFIAAALTYALAERARRSEALARRRTFELLDVAELNQGIIRHLQNGVVVVDAADQVVLLNDTARTLLDQPNAEVGIALDMLSPPLAQRWRAWQDRGGLEVPAFRPVEHRPELIPRFTGLSGHGAATTLILLEDSAQVAERLQQIKLAALGRLTAGIAHEIRNPLAAISHAAQLLQESASASTSDQRLAQIVHDNVRRANRIITDVLDLARRDRVKPERLVLAAWLEAFGQEFTRDLDGPLPVWNPTVEPDDLTVNFDPHQFRQVLWNLCANACQHGVRPGEIPQFTVCAGLENGPGRPFIEVRDAGPGIPAENIAKLFEPFFTTRSKGTGLGLYLARELCEANRAQLQYLPSAEGGSCFRITFAPTHPVPETE